MKNLNTDYRNVIEAIMDHDIHKLFLRDGSSKNTILKGIKRFDSYQTSVKYFGIGETIKFITENIESNYGEDF